MNYKRVLILHFTNGMSSRDIAKITGVGKTTINEFLKRFNESEELSYPLSEDVTNEFIEGCLYKKAGNPCNSELYREFDPEETHRAMAKKGEMLKHLWKKYNAAGIVNGQRPLSYRQYCRRYTTWLDNTNDDFAISRYSEDGIKILYHLIKTRTDLKTSTVFTSQYAPSEWGKYLSDEENCYGKLDGIRRRLTTGYTVHIEKL